MTANLAASKFKEFVQNKLNLKCSRSLPVEDGLSVVYVKGRFRKKVELYMEFYDDLGVAWVISRRHDQKIDSFHIDSEEDIEKLFDKLSEILVELSS